MKRNIIFTSLLIIGIGVTVSVGFAQEQTKESAPTMSTATTSEDESAAISEKPKFHYNSKGKSDPMDAPWYHKGTGYTPGPRVERAQLQINVEDNVKNELTGIVYCETNSAGSLAILGKQIVKNGDTVKISQLPKSVKIIKINRQDIVLLYDGKTYPVKMSGK